MYSKAMCSVAAISCLLLSTNVYGSTMELNALRAVPRFGNDSCWADTGARLKNICSTTQLISFMPDEYLFGQTVKATIGVVSAFATVKCQDVYLTSKLDNYWTLGPFNSNGLPSAGISFVSLAPWLVKGGVYYVDCQVPPGAQITHALFIW